MKQKSINVMEDWLVTSRGVKLLSADWAGGHTPLLHSPIQRLGASPSALAHHMLPGCSQARRQQQDTSLGHTPQIISLAWMLQLQQFSSIHYSETVNPALSILGIACYFEQWGSSPSSFWKPKVTKLLLKISRGAFVDYVTQQVFRI